MPGVAVAGPGPAGMALSAPRGAALQEARLGVTRQWSGLGCLPSGSALWVSATTWLGGWRPGRLFRMEPARSQTRGRPAAPGSRGAAGLAGRQATQIWVSSTRGCSRMWSEFLFTQDRHHLYDQTWDRHM